MNDPEPAYYVRLPGKAAQGPFPVSRIQRYVAEGRVRVEMEFSDDGQRWWSGREWPDMFPAAAPPPAPAPAPAPVRASRREAPVPASPRRASSRRAAPSRTREPREGGRARRARPPKRNNAPMLILLILVVLGGGIAMWALASGANEREEGMQRAVEILEESCRIVESHAQTPLDLDGAARLPELRKEMLAIADRIGDMRSATSDSVLERRYAPKIRELMARLKRGSDRMAR